MGVGIGKVIENDPQDEQRDGDDAEGVAAGEAASIW